MGRNKMKLLVSLTGLLILAAYMPNAALASRLWVEVYVYTNKSSYQLREVVDVYGEATHFNNLTQTEELVTSGLAGIQVDSPLVPIVARTQLLGQSGSQTGFIEILSTTLCDDHGVATPGVIRGNTAYFRTVVRNNGPSTKRVTTTMNVYDNASIPIGLLASEVDIPASGTTDVIQSLYIEQWAKNGTAVVYANAFTDWPNNNGHPWCPEKSASFALWESQYDESVAGLPPQQIIVNGTYDIQFRLSPEPMPGTYTVKVTAYHEGFTNYQPATATFTVVDVTAAPRASFTVGPPMIGPGYQVKFDASSSTAEGFNDTIKTYKWKFGDTQNATGKIVYHTYPVVNNYTVTLNVTDNEGFWNTTTRKAIIIVLHNAAVLNIQSPSDIYDDWKVTVTVTVKNRGTVNDSFNVTLNYNTTLIEKQTVSSLAPYATQVLTFKWNFTGLLKLHNYTLQAIASTIPGETQTGDNTNTFGPIFVRMLGDVKYSRRIDILDVVGVTACYGARLGESNWNIMADLQPDSKIDVLDVVKVTTKYGQTY